MSLARPEPSRNKQSRKKQVLAGRRSDWRPPCRAVVSGVRRSRIMSDAKPIWIRDPLAILADGAERGIVVRDGRIVERVPAGGAPATADAAGFHAGEPGV